MNGYVPVTQIRYKFNYISIMQQSGGEMAKACSTTGLVLRQHWIIGGPLVRTEAAKLSK